MNSVWMVAMVFSLEITGSTNVAIWFEIVLIHGL